jgi:hypothetical protein
MGNLHVDIGIQLPVILEVSKTSRDAHTFSGFRSLPVGAIFFLSLIECSCLSTNGGSCAIRQQDIVFVIGSELFDCETSSDMTNDGISSSMSV